MPTNSQTSDLLIDRAQKRANLRGSSFLSDAEWLDLLNTGLARLHDILIEANQDHFEVVHPFDIEDGTEDYTLPADFYDLLSVKVLYQSHWYAIEPYAKDVDGTQSVNPNYVGIAVASPLLNLRYRLVGDRLRLRGRDDEAPDEDGSGRIYYARTFRRLTSGGTPDVYEGWEEFAVLDAAIAAVDIRQLDTSHLERQRAIEEDRIRRKVARRDKHRPMKFVRRSWP